MKSTKYLSMAVLAFLIFAGVGCTTLYETTDGYNEGPSSSRRSMMNESYYYGSNAPILVRDMYTGRYFYVYPSNSYSQLNSYGYDRRYNNSGYYGNNYGYSDNRDRYNRNESRPTVTDEQRRAKEDDARRRILGKKE